MCGIVGIFNLNKEKVSLNFLKEMTDIIKHRGPDGEGHYVDGNLGLGHRRLAIIDLTEKAKQPMTNKDKTVVITYNGEIYNFRELRKELESLGYNFFSNSDTEVVVHSYEEWGIDCINKFNGMFAFALWDKGKKNLFLVRDRYGIKPLYIWQNKNVLLFGSEIKAFLKHPDFKVELDKEVLLEYFTFQNTFTYKTLFKGVSLIPPGCYMNISSDAKPKILRYWDFHFDEENELKDESEYVNELTHLFNQAVSRQLIGDVEVGYYLSGGIDSSSIAAVAAKNIDHIKSFCIGFDLSSASGMELSFDERKKAERISYNTQEVLG